MVSSTQFYERYGDPASKQNQAKYLIVWDVPTELEIGFIPKKIYCNKDFIGPCTTAFTNLRDRKDTNGNPYADEIKTWDGCWNVRVIRGYEKKYKKLMEQGRVAEAIKLLSTHSWGCALDVNWVENQIGMKPKLSAGFAQCFIDAGFDWGGKFQRVDGMHFQLAALPAVQ
jgi:hypothetical protein